MALHLTNLPTNDIRVIPSADRFYTAGAALPLQRPIGVPDDEGDAVRVDAAPRNRQPVTHD